MSLPRSMDPHSQRGAKDVSPAAERNKQPILEALQKLLPARAAGLGDGDAPVRLLEVASGTGQHAAHCAAALPGVEWQPTEFAAECLSSIRAWCDGLPNVLPPRVLDASQADWPVSGPLDAVFAANVTHISPWAATVGLVTGAGARLAPGGALLLYGPFSVDGRPTTESNAAFDVSLRARNPEWGYRDVADVAAVARGAGMALESRLEMPANNFLLVLRKQP